MHAHPDPRQHARDSVTDFARRCEALRPHLQPGLNYIRRVRDSYDRAFWSWDADATGAHLVEAEIAAHLRPEEDFLNRFQPDVYNRPPSLPTPPPAPKELP